MIEYYRKLWAAGQAMYEAHAFDRTPTGPIIAFEAFLLAFSAVTLYWLWKTEKKGAQRFFLAAGGLFIHQFFTSPMWHNYKLGWWSYLYQDISWISTFAWASLIMWAITLVDRFFANWPDWKRFPLYLAVLAPAALVYEAILLRLGVSGYSPEVQQAISGRTLLGTPVETFVYVPVFMALVVSFTKYWSFYILRKPVIPLRHRQWLRSLGITFASVLLFEVTVEPMVQNIGFPAWSYIFHDITLALTGAWVALTWLAINLVDKFFIHFSLRGKFLAYLAAVFVFALPAEIWLIASGHRVYGSSTVAAFTGLHIPWTMVPTEIAFGVPLYFALILSFVKYWEIVLDNK